MRPRFLDQNSLGRRLPCQAIIGKFSKKVPRASTSKVWLFNQLIFIGMETGFIMVILQRLKLLDYIHFSPLFLVQRH